MATRLLVFNCIGTLVFLCVVVEVGAKPNPLLDKLRDMIGLKQKRVRSLQLAGQTQNDILHMHDMHMASVQSCKPFTLRRM